MSYLCPGVASEQCCGCIAIGGVCARARADQRDGHQRGVGAGKSANTGTAESVRFFTDTSARSTGLKPNIFTSVLCYFTLRSQRFVYSQIEF